MVAELQTVSREACTAMIEHAYAMGYMDAKERERKRKKALREKRERKRYFITQKLHGVAVLILAGAACIGTGKRGILVTFRPPQTCGNQNVGGRGENRI